MKRLLAAMAVVLSACGVDGRTEAFRSGFPRSTTVELKVPGEGSTQGLTGQGTRRDGLEGETAELYRFTRGVTGIVNGAVAFTLSLIERIAEYPPTSLSADTAVWGPHTDPLSPNTWRFTVTRRADNDYAYVLEGRAKSAPDSEFKAILSGTHVSAGRHLGNGSFLIDWDAAKTLPEHGTEVGTGAFSYARPTTTDVVVVDADFAQVRDAESGQLVDAKYRFRQTPGQGGAFEFQMNKDFASGSLVELLTVRSRWQESGAGRSDARATGGDLLAPATANECWDASFLSRFFTNSFDPTKIWGDPAVCAFAVAEYASL